MSTAFGDWTPDDGCTDAQVTATEDHLGISLPDALRDYYATAGRHPELMGLNGHEHTLRVTAPEHLDIEDGHLVFCGENRWPARWSVRPDDVGWPDPRVHGRSEPGGKWYSESRRLSAFLINVAGRQAVASLPHRATCRVREQQLGVVESLLSYVGSREMQKGGHWLSFVDPSRRLLASYSYNTATLHVGAVEHTALASLHERSGLTLKPA
ncbi:SMI1/KNR4 family protein [Streptomyces sp. SID13726]|uniref:SMI1/KNR4 family protein n=1 Tax=Streptomyces sp. SID13726 TaxID=2706058 RepID=UPI0013BDF2A8|nr:SMI1/KNR4 family protein [Streptomyces sp. SID13726]NEB04913.1 SMI1/KNR4 family protein [Streptomyces sp. SID13726]